MRVHLRASNELRKRLTAIGRRAGAGNEQADGTVDGHVPQLRLAQVVDDEDAKGRRSGHRFRGRRTGRNAGDEHHERDTENEQQPETKHPPSIVADPAAYGDHEPHTAPTDVTERAPPSFV
jgi:hypothetical protein